MGRRRSVVVSPLSYFRRSVKGFAAWLPAGSGVLRRCSAAPAAHAAMPGINGKIAFQRDRDGSGEIYAMSPNGSAQTRLRRTTPIRRQGRPHGRPTARRLVIACFEATEFCLRNADGSGSRQLLRPLGTVTHSGLVAGRLARHLRRGDRSVYCEPRRPDECWTLGGHRRSSTSTAQDFTIPDATSATSRSPSAELVPVRGTRIVYTGSLENGRRHRRRRAHPRRAARRRPNWSPDGTRIAYTRDLGRRGRTTRSSSRTRTAAARRDSPTNARPRPAPRRGPRDGLEDRLRRATRAATTRSS